MECNVFDTNVCPRTEPRLSLSRKPCVCLLRQHTPPHCCSCVPTPSLPPSTLLLPPFRQFSSFKSPYKCPPQEVPHAHRQEVLPGVRAATCAAPGISELSLLHAAICPLGPSTHSTVPSTYKVACDPRFPASFTRSPPASRPFFPPLC